MPNRTDSRPSLRLVEAPSFKSFGFPQSTEWNREELSKRDLETLKLTRTRGLNALNDLIEFNPDCQDLFDAFKGLANGLILIANSVLNPHQDAKANFELERSGIQSLTAAYGAYFRMRNSPLIASEQAWDEESMAFHLLSAHSEMARVVDRATRAVKTSSFEHKAFIDAVEALENCADFLKSARPARC